MQSFRRGFSLIEMLVVMAVMGVVAAALMPLAEVTVQRERERELKRALWEIRDAIDAYKGAAEVGLVAAGRHGYPPSLEALTQPVPGANGQLRRFLRRLPRDPFAPSDIEAARSWGLRSYESPPDRPQPGSDVYDVYSLSDRTGLNGIPLRAW